MPRIDLFRDGLLELQVAVEDRQLRIGRGERCDIRINDPKVSRHHALIFPTEAGYVIRDLSRNGTWVNDARVVGECPLNPGDRIQLGDQVGLVFGSDYPPIYLEGETDSFNLSLFEGDDRGPTADLGEDLHAPGPDFRDAPGLAG